MTCTYIYIFSVITRPAYLRTDGEFWSARGRSESTSASSAAREPETAPDEAPPPFFSPSFAPTQDRTRRSATRLPAPFPPHAQTFSTVFTLSSSVSFSFLSFSLSTAFSSQRRALAFRSLAPPEITPDFWNSVPSRATVCEPKRQTFYTHVFFLSLYLLSNKVFKLDRLLTP